MIDRYVNTASTAGGDGTTNATSGANRAYASLSEWYTANAAVNLTAGGLNDRYTVHCTGASADTVPVTISGWTVDATHYLTITVDQAVRHPGKYDTGKYRLEVTSDAYALEIAVGYTRVIGLQLTGPDQAFRIALRVNAPNLPTYLEACIVRGPATSVNASVYGVRGTSDSQIFMRNCLLYRWNNSGGSALWLPGLTANPPYHYIYSSTFANCLLAIDESDGFREGVYDNNLATGCTTVMAGQGIEAKNNATNLATGFDGATSAGNRVSQTFTFVDDANADWHLQSSDVGAKGFGLDLSGDATYPFSDDIDGESRGATWDIGADQYVVVTLPPAGPIPFSGRRMQSVIYQGAV